LAAGQELDLELDLELVLELDLELADRQPASLLARVQERSGREARMLAARTGPG
jgi:hypothetical protein